MQPNESFIESTVFTFSQYTFTSPLSPQGVILALTHQDRDLLFRITYVVPLNLKISTPGLVTKRKTTVYKVRNIKLEIR